MKCSKPKVTEGELKVNGACRPRMHARQPWIRVSGWRVSLERDCFANQTSINTLWAGSQWRKGGTIRTWGGGGGLGLKSWVEKQPPVHFWLGEPPSSQCDGTGPPLKAPNTAETTPPVVLTGSFLACTLSTLRTMDDDLHAGGTRYQHPQIPSPAPNHRRNSIFTGNQKMRPPNSMVLKVVAANTSRCSDRGCVLAKRGAADLHRRGPLWASPRPPPPFSVPI